MKHHYPDVDDSQPAAHGARPVHKHVLSDLKAWLDGELAAPRVWVVRAHLLFCPSCREEVTWLKRLGEDMRDLERAVPSPRLRARILAALPDTPPGRPEVRALDRLRIPRYAMACAAMACAGLAWVVTRQLAGTGGANASHTSTADVRARPQPPAAVASTGATRNTAQNVAPDPYTLEADRRFAEWMQDQEQRTSHEIRNNQSSWKKLVASIRSSDTRHRKADVYKLTLSVSNVGEAEKRLTAWAQTVGGTGARPTAVATPQGAPPPVTSAEQPSPASPAASRPSEPVVVTVRVPAARLASLEPVLKQIGAFGTSAATSNQAGQTSSGTGAGTAVTDNQMARRVDRVTDASGQAATPAAVTPRPSDQVAARDSGLAMVTLRIQLSSFETPIP